MAAPTATSTPLRVGYVAKAFPRLSETFVLHEIRELERQNAEVTVFSLHAGAAVPHRALTELRARIIQVDARPEPDDARCRRTRRILTAALAQSCEGHDLAKHLLARKYVRLACQLADAARPTGVRSFHAHFGSRATHVAMLAGALLDLPYTFTAHAKDIHHAEVDRDALRLKLACAARCVTVTDYNLRVLREIGAGLPELDRRLVRLYNGVDLDRFHPIGATARRGGRILGVGRLVEKKGFDVLVRACATLKRRGVAFTCALVGGGEQEDALRTLAARLDVADRIAFRGPQAVEAVADAMRQATVVALPCVVGADGNVDALPTVLLEAMGCALPVVSTTVSGVPEIVADGETGYLVPPHDVDALAAALARTLADPAHAAALGSAGRARAERLFDLHRNVAQLHAWLVEAQRNPARGLRQ